MCTPHPIALPVRCRLAPPQSDALARRFAPSGIAGFVVGATTGEGLLLRTGEIEAAAMS